VITSRSSGRADTEQDLMPADMGDDYQFTYNLLRIISEVLPVSSLARDIVIDRYAETVGSTISCLIGATTVALSGMEIIAEMSQS
jgi:hypothetical protein